MQEDLLYQIALTLVPNIGDVHAKSLINIYGNAQSIFKAKRKDLENIDGIGTVRAGSIKSFDNFQSSEEEIAFIEKYKITPLFITDDKYPQRLLNCYDSPTLLYYRGNADLNTSKIIGAILIIISLAVGYVGANKISEQYPLRIGFLLRECRRNSKPDGPLG